MTKSHGSSEGSARAATGSGRSATTSSGERHERHVCSFWLGGRCFGLDVALVGEIVPVEEITPVPMAKAAVRGVFNLRGSPLALMDLGAVLELPVTDASAATTALVLRSAEMVVGVGVERVDAIIPAGRGALVAPRGTEEHFAVQGLLEVAGRAPITVLDADAVLQRLRRLRYVDATER